MPQQDMKKVNSPVLIWYKSTTSSCLNCIYTRIYTRTIWLQAGKYSEYLSRPMDIKNMLWYIVTF
jgi:hypothetical protein